MDKQHPQNSKGLVMFGDCFTHHSKWLEEEAPRYTSYPSALYFKSLASEVYTEWLQSLDRTQSIGLYIHIPYCNQLCWFCGCHTKVTNHYEPIALYVKSLVKEIELLGRLISHKPNLHCVHFGGGSPTILNNEDMESIFKAVHHVFNIKSECEIAIEIDPRRLTKEKTQSYRQFGFNRVSLGVQDTNKEVQAAINRIQPFDMVKQCCDMLREEGVSAINMDLIYGLPFQNKKTIETTIKQIVSLAPSRLAYYSFAHVPWVKKHQNLILKKDLPDTNTKGQMYLHASKIIEENGYTPLGIDHFSLPDDDCFKGLHHRNLKRNFMGYTAYPNDYIIGVGSSSVSSLGKGLAQNTANFTDYKHAIDQGNLPTTRGWVYSAEDCMRKSIIEELMCYFSVNIEKTLVDFNYPVNHLDENLKKLSELEKAGIVSIENRCVNFHSPLRMIVRSVCSVFDPYFSNDGKCSRVA